MAQSHETGVGDEPVMMHNSSLILATVFAFLPLACSSDETSTAKTSADGGAGKSAGGSAGHGGRAGSGGSAGSAGSAGYGGGTGGSPTVTCGGTECTLPIGGGIERLKACCTEAGGCGLKLPNVAKCLPRDMPGTRAPECPSPTFTTPGGDVLASCCGTSGCGALDPFLGCIPNPEIGATAVACTYDPTNDCSALTSVTCDGAEDCPGGQRCCAKLEGGSSYTQFGCFASCAALADAGTTWRELCHAGDACEGAGLSCLGSLILPAPLARCDTVGGADPSPTADRSADHVNCGASVCGAGEKCCVRPPHTPYCAKAGESCKCKPVVDGGGADSSARDASGD